MKMKGPSKDLPKHKPKSNQMRSESTKKRNTTLKEQNLIQMLNDSKNKKIKTDMTKNKSRKSSKINRTNHPFTKMKNHKKNSIRNLNNQVIFFTI